MNSTYALRQSQSSVRIAKPMLVIGFVGIIAAGSTFLLMDSARPKPPSAHKSVNHTSIAINGIKDPTRETKAARTHHKSNPGHTRHRSQAKPSHHL